jgi:hypothetical protein
MQGLIRGIEDTLRTFDTKSSRYLTIDMQDYDVVDLMAPYHAPGLPARPSIEHIVDIIKRRLYSEVSITEHNPEHGKITSSSIAQKVNFYAEKTRLKDKAIDSLKQLQYCLLSLSHNTFTPAGIRKIIQECSYDILYCLNGEAMTDIERWNGLSKDKYILVLSIKPESQAWIERKPSPELLATKSLQLVVVSSAENKMYSFEKGELKARGPIESAEHLNKIIQDYLLPARAKKLEAVTPVLNISEREGLISGKAKAESCCTIV